MALNVIGSGWWTGVASWQHFSNVHLGEATVGNPFLYILSWLAGSVVTCIMLGLLKKPVES